MVGPPKEGGAVGQNGSCGERKASKPLLLGVKKAETERQSSDPRAARLEEEFMEQGPADQGQPTGERTGKEIN